MGGRTRPRHRARAGLAGIEFALVSPLLLTLFLGTIDLSNALLTARRMEIAAAQVAEIGSTSSATTTTLNALTLGQAWQATTAPFALFPQWTNKTTQPIFAITLSDVEFTPSPAGCTQGCTYVAQVKWSVANELGAARTRACGTLASAPDGDAFSYTTLPADAFGATSVLVADISYTFQPMFFGFLIGNIPMMQSAYVSPRIDSGTTLNVPNPLQPDEPGGAATVNPC